MALSGKYVESSYIIEEIFREFPFEMEIDPNSIFEWIFKAIGLIGANDAYVMKSTDGLDGNPDPVVVTEYRGELPSDLIGVKMIREYDTKMPMVCQSATFADEIDLLAIETQFKYTINNNYVFTSFEEGKLEILYKAFPTDSLGLPLIPDDPRFIEAVKYYVAERIAFRLYLEDRLAERKYEKINQKWLFYVASAGTKAKMPSIDKMETIKNRWLRLKQNPNLHNKSFQYLPQSERLIVRNTL